MTWGNVKPSFSLRGRLAVNQNQLVRASARLLLPFEFEKRSELVGGQRATEEISLQFIATKLHEKACLSLGLDTFDNPEIAQLTHRYIH